MRRALAALGREALGLFVDSWGMAVAILVWIAVLAVVPVAAAWRGAALFGGLAAALAGSCWRHGGTKGR